MSWFLESTSVCVFTPPGPTHNWAGHSLPGLAQDQDHACWAPTIPAMVPSSCVPAVLSCTLSWPWPPADTCTHVYWVRGWVGHTTPSIVCYPYHTALMNDNRNSIGEKWRWPMSMFGLRTICLDPGIILGDISYLWSYDIFSSKLTIIQGYLNSIKCNKFKIFVFVPQKQ